jgi:erythromycin esterase
MIVKPKGAVVVRRVRKLTFTEQPATSDLLAATRSLARPLRGPRDLDPLLDRIGNARFVLLGEASHGTHEFYTWRTGISRRLIEERGFSFIAVEGDWPDCYRVNQFLKGAVDSSITAREVMHGFTRWPTWMWANEEVIQLAEWLREYNDALPTERKVGFYGLDVYSLWDSLDRVIDYLTRHDPSAVATARAAFQCFEPYGEDVQEYAQATRWIDESCEDEVVALLAQVQHAAEAEPDAPEAQFDAEQNARVAKNAEHYYRTMVRGGPESWNIRDLHMTETLYRLMERHGPRAKGIVWAHNTHIGDARFTDMADDGMVNIGQLVRMRHATDTVLVGFGSHSGRVIAGVEWEAPMETMRVPPARAGSWEDLLHRASGNDCLMVFDEVLGHEEMFDERGHRAIGVVYRPQYEQYGNYVPTVLPRRYDAFLFLDHTAALRPLRDIPVLEEGEVPETFPTGV